MGWWLGRRAAAETDWISLRSLEILDVVGKSWRRGIFKGDGGWVDEGLSEHMGRDGMEATGRQAYTMKLELGGVDDAAHPSGKEGARRRVRRGAIRTLPLFFLFAMACTP